jgi:hypothetical protein
MKLSSPNIEVQHGLAQIPNVTVLPIANPATLSEAAIDPKKLVMVKLSDEEFALD